MRCWTQLRFQDGRPCGRGKGFKGQVPARALPSGSRSATAFWAEGCAGDKSEHCVRPPEAISLLGSGSFSSAFFPLSRKGGAFFPPRAAPDTPLPSARLAGGDFVITQICTPEFRERGPLCPWGYSLHLEHETQQGRHEKANLPLRSPRPPAPASPD